MYLLLDDYGNGRELFDYKDLRHLAIEEIKERLFGNLDEKDIVRDCVKELEGLIKKDYVSDNEYIEILECYGWKVININYLSSQLNILREFYAREHKRDIFGEVIDVLRNKDSFNKESEYDVI
jgi:hypothetical protein